MVTDNEEMIVRGGPAFAPSHPGEILREDVLPALKMPKARLADHLGISRQTLYSILREKRAVTADVAARLGRAFGNSAAFWLNLQSQHDAWHAERKPDVAKIAPLEMCALLEAGIGPELGTDAQSNLLKIAKIRKGTSPPTRRRCRTDA
jgi:addiction module HigA family antidote